MFGQTEYLKEKYFNCENIHTAILYKQDFKTFACLSESAQNTPFKIGPNAKLKVGKMHKIKNWTPLSITNFLRCTIRSLAKIFIHYTDP